MLKFRARMSKEPLTFGRKHSFALVLDKYKTRKKWITLKFGADSELGQRTHMLNPLAVRLLELLGKRM